MEKIRERPDSKKRPERKFYEVERQEQQDLRRMYSWFPPGASYLQRYVNEACDRMEYEGSRMYDEIPDRHMMLRECGSIAQRVKADQNGIGVEAGACRNCGNMPEEVLQDLIQSLFFNEVFRRREKRRRCRNCFR